jgi:hypothetical protein
VERGLVWWKTCSPRQPDIPWSVPNSEVSFVLGTSLLKSNFLLIDLPVNEFFQSEAGRGRGNEVCVLELKGWPEGRGRVSCGQLISQWAFPSKYPELLFFCLKPVLIHPRYQTLVESLTLFLFQHSFFLEGENNLDHTFYCP